MHNDSRTLLLGVNIDHVATLRQVRLARYPDPVEAAFLCREAGADSITVHLREDRRHIQDSDVYRLNLEMANYPEIVRIAVEVRPEEVCLVPEKRAELTTEGGLDVLAHRAELAPTLRSLDDAGIVVSLFIDPDPAQIRAAAELGSPFIELHTGTFCDAEDPAEAEMELRRLVEGAALAHSLGLKVNAGHGIHLGNIDSILRIPHLQVLNIGHSIVSRAVMVGMGAAVHEMKHAMAGY